MDITDFYQTFFDEADELLANVEKNLLDIEPDAPDMEVLNAIFRAVHSIKGGAATFGFTILQQTTHLLENLLDCARRNEMKLSTEIINLFLETKDIMQDQIDAYKSDETPDTESFEYICKALQQIAQDVKNQPKEQVEAESSLPVSTVTTSAPQHSLKVVKDLPIWRIQITELKEEEAKILMEEMSNLGEVMAHELQGKDLVVTLETSVSPDDISSVMCFIVNQEQIQITRQKEQVSQEAYSQNQDVLKETASFEEKDKAVKDKKKPKDKTSHKGNSTDASIRVAVEKVDQLINLVGELVITQSMLAQCSSDLDPVEHSDLLNGMSLLERGARDLQESVMSIRMMPMEYVFSRFPRLVRDLAGKLDKKVELILRGSSTELDKGLIEGIIDPLTHLVRNSLDHGLERPEIRQRTGKNETGSLTLSAEHQGGNIHIEVSDDGAGLNREKILSKAKAQGMAVNDEMSDNEVANLIFAPGFSTAEVVTDVSGRGVGMDVVKRNIQAMGGHVEIFTHQGQGTTVRIVLPLTMAILDGMSVKVASEVFILPLNSVMESLQPQKGDFYRVAGGDLVIHVRGEYLPLVELHQIFNVENARTDPTQGIVIILQSTGHRFALLVDQLIGQHQVVVKNLETNYRKVPGISGATILGDGCVALIVDISALQRINQSQKKSMVMS